MSTKLIAGVLVLAMVLGIWYHIDSLEDDNAKLKKDIATLTANYANLKTSATECSNSVLELAEKSDDRTRDAQVAVEKAKKEAVENYKAANAYLFAKPKVIVVTKDNAQNYGGNDSVAQMQDYLATHDLFNQYIQGKKK